MNIKPLPFLERVAGSKAPPFLTGFTFFAKFLPRYFYTSKSLTGEEKSGALEAKDEKDLAGILKQEGFVLISANLEGKTRKKKKIYFSIPFLNNISLPEKIMFTRNLKVMISAGVSLPRALTTLSEQTKTKKFRNTLLNLSAEITKGRSLSEVLEEYPNIFSELFVSMVKVGEESGTLEDVLDVLTNQMERDDNLKSSIRGAMIYPAVILSVMIGIGIIMMIFVVPTLAQTFKELDVKLPFTTRIVVAIGNFSAKFWYLIPLIILFIIISIRVISKTGWGRIIFSNLVLKIPFLAGLVRKINSAYTARTIGSLIASGVSLVRSLEITAGVLGNLNYKNAIMAAAEEIKKGEKLSQVLSKYQNIYSPLVIQMLAVGEETGHTADLLQKLADFFEEEVNRATKNLSTVIEPALMILIGAAVGFFAVSMIQPIYSMVQTL